MDLDVYKANGHIALSLCVLVDDPLVPNSICVLVLALILVRQVQISGDVEE